MNVTFLEDHPFFPVSLLQGESVSEEPNCVVPLESTSPTLVTLPLPLPDLNPHNTVLPTNQVLWIAYYRRNLISKSDIVVPEEMGEKGSAYEIEVMAKTTGDEAKQDHSVSLDSAMILKNIHTALEFSQSAVMEEMRALKRTRLGNSLRGIKLWGVNGDKNWPLYQLNVKNAFLNGDIKEEIHRGLGLIGLPYFSSPKDIVRGTDHTLFTKVSKAGKIVVLSVYVDDIVLSGDDIIEIIQLKKKMGDDLRLETWGL
ncbi:Cysteine-rich RLK (RECEPTOR-like protein kinase) 8 [Cucumis melo var. makuwa]|uniref:Cysteine-rich RLK (RECEPTOR-like protein kinase) 8 n=1 Tax=Cucumis melo var. makuwa TaxID=1194695 RepID=A0A5A7T1V0_CUCMM|nr:Cysteine-rich RLK (RECEPTOR-like protein kinase) 8 [Cucumis melo var. makuwa]TYK30973.1 Cysteine-rich RLK (RECEPTOR-like protein kinase) 8 [Cucumis melo var. makuwa]